MIAVPHRRETRFARITRFGRRQPDAVANGNGATPAPAPDPNAPVAASAAGSQRTLRRTVREDGLCLLTFDRPGSGANIFDRRALTELGEELEAIARDQAVKGLVLISAKRSIFIAGADLKAMGENASPQEVRSLIELGQQVMNRLAELNIPTVAAVHGAAVGGGYELCLACDYRVASTDRATKLGLPETQLGLLPAWGGSTRLPRLIGVPQALDIILAGKTLAAKPALKRGLVDELAPVEYLVNVATRLLKRGKRKLPARSLVNNRLAAALIAARVRGQLLRKTRGHYPAILKALEVITRGISRPVAESLALECEALVELVRGEACRNLIRVFFLQERAKKLSVLGSKAEPKPINRAAVVGAGVMGAGIAQWLSARRLRVILRDVGPEPLAKGMASIASLYQEGARRHAFTACEARAGLDRIQPSATDVPLRNTDLVIEAAAERLDLKRQIFKRLDELAGEETILATNTSALPISELAAGTRRPERVLGLHFFNPVHRMQLVEIIAARQTSPEVLHRAVRFAQQIGKLPVIVKDSPGFLVNRILMPYLLEAGNLFAAGADVQALDRAMLAFGMPMGPLRLLDEVGLDVALHVANTLAAHFPDRMTIPPVFNQMIQSGLLGRKTGRGFYLHPKGKDPQPNQELAVYQSANADQAQKRRSAGDYASLMSLLMVNEAARCLEEQIISEPADVDFAMIMGTGFAPFRGGPLRYADNLGLIEVVGQMNRLVDSGARHLQPCELLARLAAAGKVFYP